MALPVLIVSTSTSYVTLVRYRLDQNEAVELQHVRTGAVGLRAIQDDTRLVLVDLTLTARGAEATAPLIVTYTDDNAKLAAENESVQLDHQQTVVKTELGKGNVEAAETQVERMTRIHGEDVDAVQEVERQTQLVREGGRAERNRATKIVEDDHQP